MKARARLAASVTLLATAALLTALPASAPAGVAHAKTVTAVRTTTAASGVDLAHLSLGFVPVASGFTHPLYVTNAHDGSGRLFVLEQAGRIRVVRGGVVQPHTFLDISAEVTDDGERGLLGLAFAPGYPTNGRFYIYYTNLNGDTVVERCIASDPKSDTPSISRKLILFVKQPYANHNGGCLQFGSDKYLYIGLGDGGFGGDPGHRAQNRTTLLGKILRVDTGDRVSPSTFTGTYKIPPSNPFYKKKGYRKEIWALGLRNPWRFSFDTRTNDLWTGDVGQDKYEEIDFAKANKAGLNYGWRIWEGNHRFSTLPKTVAKKGYAFPVLEYPHPVGECVTGGYVYRGAQYPALYGTYVYADFLSGWFGGIKRVSASGAALKTPQRARLAVTSMMVSSFGTGEDREVYFCDWQGGVVYHLTASTK